MTEPLDDMLRDALRAEVAGVQAPNDGPRQLRRALRRRRRRRGALLAVAASVVAGVAITSLALARSSDDHSPVISDAPPTAPDSTTTPAPDTSSTAVDPRDASGPRPEQMVAATDDGRLVVLDVASGTEVRELARAGVASDYQNAGSEPFIDAVEVSSDGATVYYSTCCEPAPGAMFAVPLDGSDEPVRLALDGAYPDLRPGADQIAVANTIGVYAYELPVGTLESPAGSSGRELAASSGNASNPFWLGPTSMAFHRFDPNEGSSIAVVTDIDSDAPRVSDLSTESGVGWEHPVGSDAAIIVAEQCCAPDFADDVVGRILDPSTGAVLDSFTLDGPVADLDLSSNWLLITYTNGNTTQIDLAADEFTSTPLAGGIATAAFVPPPPATAGETATGLTAEQARTAEAEVRAFLDDLGRGDLDGAQDRLSSYASSSAAELAADPVLSRLAQDEVVITVNPSWSFTDASAVVTASARGGDDGGLVAAAFLVDARQPLGFDGGPIQRVQTVEETPSIDAAVAPGEQIAIPGVPVEGGGRAFLGDAEVPLEVDYEALEMRVTYPRGATLRVLTISTATPELPTATAFVLDLTG